MPYIIHKSPKSPQGDEFVQAIVTELRHPASSQQGEQNLSPAPQLPVIEEEETPVGLLHVTVIWDKWASMETRQRGSVILDAYREFSEEKMRRISIALGLTHSEAHRLGVI